MENSHDIHVFQWYGKKINVILRSSHVRSFVLLVMIIYKDYDLESFESRGSAQLRNCPSSFSKKVLPVLAWPVNVMPI